MKNIYILFIFFAGFFSLQACNTKSSKDPIPTYLHIDSFSFQKANYPLYGSSSHKITCAWIYYNNAPVAVVDLPATVPVITNGNSGLITVIPGITVDGLSAFQAQYPFYTADTFTLTTDAGKITSHLPSTTYTSVCNKVYNMDFEGGTNFQTISGDTVIVSTGAAGMVFEGARSGIIALQPGKADSCEILYQDTASFVTGNAYFEINYQNTTQFAVGLLGFDASGNSITHYPEYLIGVNPSSKWNKMYIAINTIASKYLSLFPGSKFRLAIKAILPNGQSSGYVLLDNIKYITD